jgi:hypothetical protein
MDPALCKLTPVTCADADAMRREVNGRCAPGFADDERPELGRLPPKSLR